MMLSRKHQQWAGVAGIAVLALLAPRDPAASPAGPQLVIQEFQFVPAELTIKAGETVTWTNRDEEAHTIVSDSGLFRSALLDTDQTFAFRFEKPGTYHFACSLHPRMVGTIIVQ